jgi:bifunctional UDP-N-acetylglucosamine pyrophosphorylase/glucosamine-1-phosphate N-acetyltransferase
MAGGLGTRMKSRTPKHLHPLLGRRMVDWVLEAARPLAPDPFVLVCSPQSEVALRRSLPDGLELAVQLEPRGTGDAVGKAKDALAGFEGDVLVLSGDTPLLTTELLEELLATHREAAASVTVLSFVPEDAGGYGRVLRAPDGSLLAIVEARDAKPEELEVDEVNSSIYVFRAADLWDALTRLAPDNVQSELYLTDAVRDLVSGGRVGAVHVADDPTTAEGVNTRAELAVAASALRDRIAMAHMLAGVTVVDPRTTWIDPDVVIEAEAVVHPFTVLRGHTVVRSEAEVGPHAVVVDAEVAHGATAGPFCYLRPGTVLDAGAKVGTFVEVKNSRLGVGAKVPHLSYIGDADVGEGANVAAGNITANFPHEPGVPKGRTTIGRNVRTGVHNTFIAPVTVGDEAWIGAGSTISEDVPARALAIARARQVNKEGYVGKRDD